MTDPQDMIPGPTERAALNKALRTRHAESGFWDEDGRVAPWPDDIDQWQPATEEPITPEPGQPPFKPTRDTSSAHESC